jgi:tetratricopeptide (TPR) repeat protein
MKIFLSAVTGELGRYREELHRALLRKQLEPRIQEYFRPGTATLLEMLRDYIRECDRVILLVGERCGAFPQENEVNAIGSVAEFARYCAHTGQSRASYTQWEFFLARHFGKPIQVFFTGKDFVPEEKNPEAEDLRACQQAYRDWIKHLGLVRSTISTTGKLNEDVLVDNLATHSGPRPNNLPYPSMGHLFKGRDQFIADLKKSLARTEDGKATAITQSAAVHGLGGVGKTRLAVEYAWQHAADYTALLFVTADSPENLRRNLAALAAADILKLAERDLPSEEERKAAVLSWLETHPGWFLILDNVDTKEAAQAAEDILAKLRHGHVLITSRLAQWSGSVEPLPLDVLTPAASVEFLLARTDKRRQNSATDAADAATLARELDGLALALEQAAAYIAAQHITLADYLTQWRAHDKTVQEWYDKQTMKYDRSVAVTWETTIAQLGPAEVALLRLFAWFGPEPIPLFVLNGEEAEKIFFAASTDMVTERGVKLETSARPRTPVAKLVNYGMAKYGEGDELIIHRVVQEIVRNRTPEQTRKKWITAALWLLRAAAPLEVDDVRTWSRWNPLRPHVAVAISFGDSAKISAPTAVLMNELAQLLNAKALYSEAEPLMRRALAIDEQSLGLDHPNVAVRLNNLALLLMDTKRLAEAEPLMRRALAIQENNFGLDHPRVAIDLNNLASLLQVTNRLAEAEPLMRRAWAIFEQNLGPEHRYVAAQLNNLARLLHDTKRLAEAESLMRRALAMDEQSFGPDHPNVARGLNNLAQLLQDTNRLAEAQPLMRRALIIVVQSLGAEHPRSQTVAGNYFGLLQDKGLSEQDAVRAVQEAVAEALKKSS